MAKTKVFISWSGERAKGAAAALQEFLEQVLSNCDPFFSGDIEVGRKWTEQLGEELEESSIAVICLTREALGSQYVMFEAGAVSKLGKSKVMPLLLDGLKTEEVRPPLAVFQLVEFGRDGLRAVVDSIIKELDAPPTVRALEFNFGKSWPDLERRVADAMSIELPEPEAAAARAPEEGGLNREILREILENVRHLGRQDGGESVRDGSLLYGLGSIPDQVELDLALRADLDAEKRRTLRETLSRMHLPRVLELAKIDPPKGANVVLRWSVENGDADDLLHRLLSLLRREA